MSVRRWLPTWLGGRFVYGLRDAATGSLLPTPAYGGEWRDGASSYILPHVPVPAPGGRFLAIPDGDAVAVYDLPFHPAWWLRAIAGAIALIMFEAGVRAARPIRSGLKAAWRFVKAALLFTRPYWSIHPESPPAHWLRSGRN
jgi:hypothetical protein